ncbi:MAG: glycerol kinase GlpK [Firmicutes bacterium]|nr:glycerol kinase GlpK [Bacillota bacterium]
MGEPCIIALDEGTTGTRALLMDKAGRVVKQAYRRLRVYYPRSGWVEQDPEEIWESTRAVLSEMIQEATARSWDVVGMGISNQRETAVLWDSQTGKPLHPAVVWQCRRTEDMCRELAAQGVEELVIAKTGLPIDPYFSATKMAWMLSRIDNADRLISQGRIRLGTIDTWLVWKLTAGSTFVSDVSNASRTQLLDINTLSWSEELAEIFKVPLECLPIVVPSGGQVGVTTGVEGVRDGIPILAIMGDSQAALYGETAFSSGDTKVTYGTGSSVLVNTGEQSVTPSHGLAATVGWQLNGRTTYALEGIIHATGAGIEWLYQGLSLIADPADTEAMAESVPDTGGVYFVPAFTGLGTPWWNTRARGLIVGITRGTKREHIVRAALDAIAYQVKDVYDIIEKVIPLKDGSVFCGGGASRNRYLMQLQADLLQRPILTTSNPEASGRGVATMAGLVAGIWEQSDLVHFHEEIVDEKFLPQKDPAAVAALMERWHEAVKRSLDWA